MKRNRLLIEITVAIALLIGFAFWSYQRMTNRRQAALTAIASLEQSRDLGQQIRNARQQTAFTTTDQAQSTDFLRRIEDASTKANIPSHNLTQVTPQPPRQSGKMAIIENQIQVTLADIELQQLATFLHDLETDYPRLLAKTIHIRAPRKQENRQHWDVDQTLVYTTPISEDRK